MLTKDETIEKEGIGVVVGRFQVPHLTKGHKELLESVFQRHEKVIIVLGLSFIKATKNNPLDFETRRRMICDQFPKAIVRYIKDNRSDEIWSKRLDDVIEHDVPPGQKAVLYGSRDSFVTRYSGKHKTQVLIPQTIINGTKQRLSTSLNVSDSEDFRSGVIWATQNQFDVAFPTVDIAIIDPATESLLLGRKEDENLYRFIGGFCDPNTQAEDGEFLERNARREVLEETGIELKQLEYLNSFRINDWRYRSENSKIFTTFFAGYIMYGQPKPGDDIYELKWFDIDEPQIIRENVVPEHQILLNKFLEYHQGKAKTTQLTVKEVENG